MSVLQLLDSFLKSIVSWRLVNVNCQISWDSDIYADKHIIESWEKQNFFRLSDVN